MSQALGLHEPEIAPPQHVRTGERTEAFHLGVVLVFLAGCTFWAYWPTLEAMAHLWASNPQYSHGFLVPVFALIVLWSRRQAYVDAPFRPSWWGLPVLFAAVSVRLFGAEVGLGFLEGPSLLATLGGLCLLVGGRRGLRWTWPALAFLGFMLPLPYKVETALGTPLRSIATAMSTYALQTLGAPALAEGNVILLDDMQLGVIEACSGLGMLLTFFALATAVALVISRSLLDRIVIVLSAVPIAIVANVTRITATGVVAQTLGEDAAKTLFHDLAGWLMMPLALLLLWLELAYLRALLPESAVHGPLPLALVRGKPGTREARRESLPPVLAK